MTAGVALIGASGHGVWHRRTIAALAGARLVAVSDVRPPEPTPDAPLDGVAVFTDHREMLAAVRPDVVVICTPPHTHLPMALDVLACGADLLLEKPPVCGPAEHAALTTALAASGRRCQVNFQALGSAALDRLIAAIDAGELGRVDAVGGGGAWWRAPEYWRRSAWSGRRSLNGRPVVDGALVNAFAHAVMQGLAVAAAAGFGHPVTATVERYRAQEIEVEDTGCLRIAFAAGRRLTVAVTLAAREFMAGDIVVAGSGGTATLQYPTDRLRLPGSDPVEVPGREGLLDNLLAHRRDPSVPLRAPLERTGDFTAILAAVVTAPQPTPVPPAFLVAHEGGHAIDGVESAVRAAASTGALLSELDLPWATARPHEVALHPTGSRPADAER